MKKQQPKARDRATPRPTRTAYTALRQIVQWIPEGLPDRIAREAEADIRTFSCTSHVPALLCGQITRASSLNEICDAARLHEPELNRIRGATAPKRDTFSNANRTRDPAIAEKLYWAVSGHLRAICPSFTQYAKHGGFIFRLKRDIFAIDSTTLQLTLDCIDWARHRRRKAAAKTRMRLNVGAMLPADRAYVDLAFLSGLTRRGVFFVLREKGNMVFEVTGRRRHKDPRILADETVRMSRKGPAEKYREPLRRVTAIVGVDGKDVEMAFVTNNFAWSPRTVAEPCRARRAIETFFKELKQTLQLADFVGYNEKAVKWQVRTGLPGHLPPRFLKHVSKWGLSFSRLAGTVRSALWMRIDLLDALRFYGTAGGPSRPVTVAEHLCFKGFERFSNVPVGQHPSKTP